MEQVYPPKMVTDVVSQKIKNIGEIGQSTIRVICSTTVAGLHTIREVATKTTALAGDNLSNTIRVNRKKGADYGSMGKAVLVGRIQSICDISVITIEVITKSIRIAIKGIGEIVDNAVKVFHGVSVGALLLTKNVGFHLEEALFSIARTAINDLRDTGTDSPSVVDDIALCSTSNPREPRDNYLNVYYSTSREVIKETAEIISDLFSLMFSTFGRTISTIESIANSAEEKTAAAVTGVVESTCKIGMAAGKKVTNFTQGSKQVKQYSDT
jgi:hypothetical protein